MITSITTLIQWLFGVKSEQDKAIDRNREAYYQNTLGPHPLHPEWAKRQKTTQRMD